MKKSLLKIAGSHVIQKEAQKLVNGGLVPVSGGNCPSRCSSVFLCPGSGFGGDGHVCIIDGPTGDICWGTIRSNQCCI